MRRTAPGFGVALLLLVPVLLPAPVQAQGSETRTSEERASREDLQRRIVQQFERRMARELRLDPAQVEQVQEVVNSMMTERRALFQRRRELHARIERFKEEGSQRMARSILSEVRAVRAEEARIEGEEEARLLEIMSPAQVLRFRIMRDELNDRIRRMHRNDSDSTRVPRPGNERTDSAPVR